MTEGKNGIVRQADGRCHITNEQFCDWLAGEMPPDRETEFLGHIGNCTFCAHQFAEWMEAPPEPPELAVSREEAFMNQPGLLNPPRYLKEEIIQRTQQPSVQMGVHVRQKSRQMQLFMYSLKVGLAVTASIFLLMLTANVQELQPETVREWRTEQMQQRQEADSREETISISHTLNQKSREISGFLCDISNGLFRMGLDETE
jgi:anti-sigma factor RsiW